MDYYPSLWRHGQTISHNVVDGENLYIVGDPYIDPRWNCALHDIYPQFDFEWDRTQTRWVVVHNKPYFHKYIALALNAPDEEFVPLNNMALQYLRESMYIGSQRGGYTRWAREKEQAMKYRWEKEQKHREDEDLQAGKEIAPLLRSLHDANQGARPLSNTYGQSVFKFDGFGDGVTND